MLKPQHPQKLHWMVDAFLGISLNCNFLLYSFSRLMHNDLFLYFSYLLPELDGACTLRISYSAHSVLNVKYQSHRSR